MTTVLGLKPALGLEETVPWGPHASSAALVRDGEIVAAAEEERFTRDKYGYYTFPANSIQFVLDYADVSLSEVDIVSVGRDPKNFFKRVKLNKSEWLVPNGLSDLYHTVMDTLAAGYAIQRGKHTESITRHVNDTSNSKFTGECVFVPHHKSHAASSYYCSGFDKQLSISIDGAGEHDCTVVWSDSLERIKEFVRPNSIGKFYAAGTEYLGFTKPTPNRQAGKTMGLAPYGRYRDDFEAEFEELYEYGDGEYDVTTLTAADDYIGLLEERFGERRTFSEEIEQRHKDFAFHLQYSIEKICKHLAEYYVSETGIHNVGLSGGVAMNCKMNRAVLEMDCVENLFIQPAADDAGVSLGAALEGYRQAAGENPNNQFDNVYFGPEYENEQIEQVLRNSKLSYEKLDDAPKRAAELLANGSLVGWFQGRMEFGARALGNRSILANPKSRESLDNVNADVKHRESWRPFAPSLLFEARQEYLEAGDESPYMILLDSVPEERHDEVPAIVHVDGTTRPQTVREAQNERYHALIQHFADLTGTPMILNTSFNVSGEPIVESPEQAIRDFYLTGLDTLIIGDYLLTKH